MTGGTARVIRANALDLPLEDASVDLVVTSPPYFGLRSYQDGGQHYEGQIGDEATPAEFVDALLAATREMVRVLKPSGSIWVNLGDKYSQRVALRPSSHQDGMHPDRPGVEKDWKASRAAGLARMPYENVTDLATGRYVPEKSLIGVPWRYALRCIDDLGLILRAEVIWSKPNGLPESVTDRVRRSHETWFHFTREPRYFSAVDEVREEHAREWSKPGGINRDPSQSPRPGVAEMHPLGKLPGSVWTIPTQPLRVPDHLGVDHFAAFPMEWPRRIIRGWSPSGVCVACGEGRRGDTCGCNAPIGSPVGSRTTVDPSIITGRAGFDRPRSDSEGRRVVTRWEQRHEAQHLRDSPHRPQMEEEAGAAFAHYIRTDDSGARPIPEHLRQAWRERGWLPTAPPFDLPPTTPAVVLDPFGGTGTTALVARALGRHGISVDMSADYCRLAEWRTNDPGELARAMQVNKPPQETPDQLALEM